jgi:hypothetical protein
VQLNLEFPHSYEIEVAAELPWNGANVHYVSGAREDGLVAIVHPESGDSWFCVIPGDKIYSSPNERFFCVMGDYDVYIVDSIDPKNIMTVPVNYVQQVQVVLEKDLMVFADFMSIFAVGRDGILWRTDYSQDGVEFSSVDGDLLHGRVECYCDARYHDFAIDLNCGKLIGGLPHQ